MATPAYKSIWQIVGTDEAGNLVVATYFTPATGYVFLVFRGVSREEFLRRTRADLLVENEALRAEWKKLVQDSNYTCGLADYAKEVAQELGYMDFYGNKAGSWANDAFSLWEALPKDEKKKLRFGSIRIVDNDLSYVYGEEFVTFDLAVDGEVSARKLKPMKHFTTKGEALWQEIKAYEGL